MGNDPGLFGVDQPGLFGVDQPGLFEVDLGELLVGESLLDSPLVLAPMGRLVVTLAETTNPPFSTVAETPATAES